MTNTIGEYGLVPTWLFIGVIFRLPTVFTDHQRQKDRMEAIDKAQMKTIAMVAERRVRIAQDKNVQKYAYHRFRIGYWTLMFSNTKNMWTDPFIFTQGDGRMVALKANDGSREFLCNSIQLNPFYEVSTNRNRFVNCLAKVIPSGDSKQIYPLNQRGTTYLH